MKTKILPLYFFLISIFGLIIFRLGELTIIHGTENRNSADTQRIRIKEIPAERGIIFDRNKKQIVYNIPVFKFCPANKTECLRLDRNQSLKMEADGKDHEMVIGIGRTYPFAEVAANLLGYLGEVSQEDLLSNYCKTENGMIDQYENGDLIGRTGLEEQYECLFRGTKGGELIEVNTDGQILRKIGRKEAVPGRNIQLSIDINLQKVAYDALGGKKGAVVVSSPKNGEIYVLVSSPGFDPNILTGSANPSDTNKRIQEIFSNKNQPLFNRAISGAYPPGSVFKVITASAGLEEKKISEQTKIEDTGTISVGAFTYSNWYFTQYGKIEGAINIVAALKRSNDIFFYKLGELVGPDKIIEWSKKFHLGRVEEIDLPGETSGFLPDPTKEWYLGNTYHLAIGQGALGVTPLQINQMTAIVASKGKWCKPHLGFAVAAECSEIGVSSQTLKIITKGMVAACSSGGTAYPLFDFKVPTTDSSILRTSNSPLTVIPIACKTGTAEFGDSQGKTHAWLTAFAPVDNSEIAVTVLVEEGGEGSRVAAPIAKKVFEEYFRNKN